MYSLPSTRNLPASLQPALATKLYEVVIAHGFGLDKAFFKVGVDNGGGLGCGGAYGDSPGSYFFFTGCEVGLQA